MDDCVILSLRPHFADAIIAGRKTVEIRRKFTTRAVKMALIYASRAERAITAVVSISSVEQLSKETLWEMACQKADVSRWQFDNYLYDLEQAFAITLSDVRNLFQPVTFQELRRSFGIIPPQSYRFAPPALMRRCGLT